MRAIVSLLHHFRQTADGTVYPYSVFDYTFWRRYLDVFDEVVVFARLSKVNEIEQKNLPEKSSGPGVRFLEVPEFWGLWQYLKHYHSLSVLARETIDEKYACILRLPGYLSTMLWHELRRAGRPYAVEVVGDPWQALSPGTYTSILRPLIRIKAARDQRRECRHASIASYVTEYALQKRYPCDGWSTHYASIELPAERILDKVGLNKRIERIDTRYRTKQCWRLCFVGSLWHLAKSPDIVIGAVAECIAKGYKLELTIIGEGVVKTNLEHQVRRLGIAKQVKFTGYLPPGDAIVEQLDQADLFVLPSRSEGLPRSIIEAMARGLPCIGGNAGGFPELLEERYMVKPITVKALSQTIINTITDVKAMKEAVKRNVKKASEYQTDILQKRRVQFYTKLKNITQDWFDSR